MKCDKCHQEVLPRDDVTLVEGIAAKSAGIALGSVPRHIRCSPSRGQYIKGLGIVDNRPEYDKRLLPAAERAQYEKAWTDAYKELHRRLSRG